MVLIGYMVLIILDIFIIGFCITLYLLFIYKKLKKEYPAIDKWLSSSNYFGFKWYSAQFLLLVNKNKIVRMSSSDSFVEEYSILIKDKRFKRASFLLKMYYASIFVISIFLPLTIFVIAYFL